MQKKITGTRKTTAVALFTMMLSASVGLGGGTAHAAGQAEDEYTFDQFVVTAQRQENKELDTPATVTVITRQEIQNSGATTVTDILDRQIGFSNMSYGPSGRDYGMSSGRTIIRGLDKGTLVMVNGAPMNLLNYNGSEVIPLDSVERIEIVRGSSSTLYGSEAIGGVVNIITRKAGAVKPRTTVATTVGNYDKQWSLAQEDDKLNVYVSREYIGNVDQTGRVFPTSKYFWKLDSGNKNSAFITANLTDKLTMNWLYSELDSNRAKVPVHGYTDNTAYHYEDTRDSLNFVYDDKAAKVKSVLFYNVRDLDGYSGKPGKARTPISSETLKTYNFGMDTQKTWSLRDNKDSLIAGLTVSKENFRNKLNSGLTADRTNTSFYSSYSYQATPRFTAIIGAREQVIADYAKDQNVFAPQFQTLYKVNARTSWYTNIGKAFEMPPLNQYFTYQGSYSGLKPQRGWTYETGFKIMDGSSSWKTALFHMDIKDKFKWMKNPDNSDYLSNSGDFHNTGVEVEYQRNLNDHWQYNLAASYSNPEVNDTGKWVQDANRLEFIAGVQYKMEKWFTSMKYLLIGDREDSYYRTNEAVPSRIQLDALVRYQANANDGVILKLNNILDRNNAINEYENWDLPFNWTLTFKHTF
ncbi:MAG: TonB-dependent receptor [Veillonellales bacterium]